MRLLAVSWLTTLLNNVKRCAGLMFSFAKRSQLSNHFTSYIKEITYESDFNTIIGII